MVIIFQNEKARNHLLNYGHVFTFRMHPHKIGYDWITNKRCGKKVCDVYVRMCVPVTSEAHLSTFANHSGFDTFQEWLDTIKSIHLEDVTKGYVWLVEMRVW